MSAQFKCFVDVEVAKKLSANKWPKTMGGGGAWEDPDSKFITNGSVLKMGNDRDILIISNNNSISIEFTADNNTDDGQGFRIPVGFPDIQIMEVSGTVKNLSFDKQLYSDTIESAFFNSAAVESTKGMQLYPGDIICCSKSSLFKVMFSLDLTYMYQRVGFDIVALSNVMYT